VVAGREDRPGAGAAVARFAARAGYPLLADPLSGARHGPAAVAHYDLLLREEAFTAAARPELVLRVGDLPTSKPLRGWLASLGDVRQVAFDPDAAWQDPASVVQERLTVDPELGLAALAPPPPGDGSWLERWRAADEATERAILEALGEELSEPLVARSLAAWLGPEATLVVASSMPIRDVETFMAARADAPRVVSNRGANGIDGTVSTAYGVAAASRGPVVLLTGDVAVAHDIGGLLTGRRLPVALTIVLINNDGGGIFHFLPVAGQRDAFEEHVATPHGLPFAASAELYGARHEPVRDLDDLRAALERSLAAGGTSIIEVPSRREHNLAVHRRVAAAAARALRADAPRAVQPLG